MVLSTTHSPDSQRCLWSPHPTQSPGSWQDCLLGRCCRCSYGSSHLPPPIFRSSIFPVPVMTLPPTAAPTTDQETVSLPRFTPGPPFPPLYPLSPSPLSSFLPLSLYFSLSSSLSFLPFCPHLFSSGSLHLSPSLPLSISLCPFSLSNCFLHPYLLLSLSVSLFTLSLSLRPFFLSPYFLPLSPSPFLSAPTPLSTLHSPIPTPLAHAHLPAQLPLSAHSSGPLDASIIKTTLRS